MVDIVLKDEYYNRPLYRIMDEEVRKILAILREKHFSYPLVIIYEYGTSMICEKIEERKKWLGIFPYTHRKFRAIFSAYEIPKKDVVMFCSYSLFPFKKELEEELRLFAEKNGFPTIILELGESYEISPDTFFGLNMLNILEA